MSERIPSPRALADRFEGRVIGPDSPDYDAARAVFYGGFDRRPAVIVRVAGTRDIAAAVVVARELRLELAVYSGGHSVAGHSVVDDGLVVNLRDLKGVDIDVNGRTAWVDTGVTAGELSTAVGAHGLAVPLGDTGSVGLGGITLGGGVGLLVRKFGLTIDSLLAAEVVTADGRTLLVDAEEHPDLFWAIRGGGGNFGVATRLRFRLHPLPEVLGGMLFLPAGADVVDRVMTVCAQAPEELSAIVNVMVCPPLPFVPAELHGLLVVMVQLVYAGPAADGEAVVAPLRAAEPLADMVRPMAYAEMFPPEEAGFRPTAASRTMFLDRFDRGVAETVMRWLEASDAVVRVVQLRVLGGAMARVAPEATAFAHRDSRIMANVAAFYTSEEDRIVREAWVRDFAAALQQKDTGAYVGFLGDEGPERVRAAYPPATWQGLREVKARYDPLNLFHANQNVPPQT